MTITPTEEELPLPPRKIRVAAWLAVFVPAITVMLLAAEVSVHAGAHPVLAIVIGLAFHFACVEVLDRLVGTLVAHHATR